MKMMNLEKKFYKEIEEDAGVDFQKLSEKKMKLFNELRQSSS